MSRLMLLQGALALPFFFPGARVHGAEVCNSSMADLIIVMDESTSIHSPEFSRLLNFVASIVDQIVIGDDHTRVGVITFASQPRDIYRLTERQTKNAVRAAIMSIKQRYGDTYTHLALRRLHETILSSGKLRRKVAVVITDGESTRPSETEAEAKRVQKMGVEVIAIGIGRAARPNDKGLQTIAGPNGRVFAVHDFKALDSIISEVVTKACVDRPTTTQSTLAPTTKPTCEPAETTLGTATTCAPPGPKPIPGCSGTKLLDHIWAVSNQAGMEETRATLDLIASTVADMELGPNGVRVGMAPRTGEKKAEIRLNDHDTHDPFFEDLNLLEVSGALTDRAINYIRTEGMSPKNGARSNSVKYGILFVDSQFEDWRSTTREASLAKRADIRLIVIGVGQNIRPSQLKDLASSDDDYLNVTDYGALAELKPRIIDRLCEGISHQQREDETDTERKRRTWRHKRDTKTGTRLHVQVDRV